MNTDEARDIIKGATYEAPRVLYRALLAIYERQTQDEQDLGDTRERNGVGFTGWDGELLSSYAEQLLGGINLSRSQFDVLQRRMVKYGKQLAEVANARQEVA